LPPEHLSQGLPGYRPTGKQDGHPERSHLGIGHSFPGEDSLTKGLQHLAPNEQTAYLPKTMQEEAESRPNGQAGNNSEWHDTDEGSDRK